MPSLADYQSTTTAAFTTEGDAILPNSLTLTRLVKLGLIKPIHNANLFYWSNLVKGLMRKRGHIPSFSAWCTDFKYRISSYSFHVNYSYLNLEIQRSQYIRPKVTVHKCAETIQWRKLFKGGNYMRKYSTCKVYTFYMCPVSTVLNFTVYICSVAKISY